MRIEFPLTLAAVQRGENAQWHIGEALAKEIPPGKSGKQDDSRKKFARCAEMLVEQGFRYSAASLIILRDVAAAFPSRRRHLDIAFSAHDAAATPDNLDQALEALEKLRKPPNQDNIRMVMKAWREKDREDRAEKKAEAGKRRKAAASKKRQATTPTERKAAEREEQEATETEARYSRPPETRNVQSEPPAKAELEVQATCLKIEADAARIVKMLRENLDDLDGILDRVDPDFANGMISHHTKILTAAQKIIDRLSRQKTRFKVHQGGAA